MNKPSHLLIRLAVFFPCWLTVLPTPSAFSQLPAGTSRTELPSVERLFKGEFDLFSPFYDCWNLSYRLNDVAYERQLQLKGELGTLSTTILNPSTKQRERVQQAVRVSDAGLRRQIFLGLDRIKQRRATEHVLSLISRQIESGRLKGEPLKDAKQFQQTLQTLLTHPNPQEVLLKAMKAEAVKGFQQDQQRIEAETREAEKILDEGIEQRRQQIVTILNDKEQRGQLDGQIKQITEAINSNQLEGEQLKAAKQALVELQALRSNPANAYTKRSQAFRDQKLQEIRSRRQSLLEQAQNELSKQMLVVDNMDNGLVVVTSQTSDRDTSPRAAMTHSQAFALQIRNGNYSAKTCSAKGDCAPVEVMACLPH
ncbi:MAG: hypothetical protein KME13_24610 [Myxacorys californica WJT36-NPBG1]|jgi:hypothetical protein|nr:hypothetical protein [Myxacorys californica WJT36-NPBG1]